MIRVWLWEEAPVELRGYANLEVFLKDKVPAWLAHLPSAPGDESDLVHAFCYGWRQRLGREVATVGMSDGGMLVAGFLSDAKSREAPGELGGEELIA